MEFFAQMLVVAVPDSAWIVSGQGEILASNPASARLLLNDAGRLRPWPTDGETAWTKAYAKVQDSLQTVQLFWYSQLDSELLTVSLTPLLAVDGSLEGILGMARTEQQNMTSQTPPKDVHALLERVIHFMPNPVFVKDRYHRWMILNDAFCQFFGRDREEMLGKSDYDFFPPAEADVFWAKDNQVFASGVSNENEESFTDSEGGHRWILTRKSAFLDTQGNPILVGVITDLTERKRSEEALQLAMRKVEEASQAKSDFLAKMSHELRTPLNSILGFTTLLLKNREDALKNRELDFMARIHRNGLHLLSLINDILDLSRVESGRIPFHYETIELSALVREVFEAFEVQAQEKNLLLQTDLAPVLPFTTDRERLKQILLNLVGNAIKFTASGYVKLQLKADGRGRASIIEVIDTGPGIAESDQSLIFEAFRQLEDGTNRQHSGTGLGLAIVSNLCGHLGYELELDSETGRGSCFRLVLQTAEA